MNEQAKQDEKAKRLAERLRENLRRRKAQARAMKGAEASGPKSKIDADDAG